MSCNRLIVGINTSPRVPAFTTGNPGIAAWEQLPACPRCAVYFAWPAAVCDNLAKFAWFLPSVCDGVFLVRLLWHSQATVSSSAAVSNAAQCSTGWMVDIHNVKDAGWVGGRLSGQTPIPSASAALRWHGSPLTLPVVAGQLPGRLLISNCLCLKPEPGMLRCVVHANALGSWITSSQCLSPSEVHGTVAACIKAKPRVQAGAL
jgi:hypothetical protein